LNGLDAALAAQAQEKRQKQRKNGSAIAWDDSGWRKSKKLEPEQLESGKNQNSGGIAIWEAGKPEAALQRCGRAVKTRVQLPDFRKRWTK
jgi:hypothetical protein